MKQLLSGAIVLNYDAAGKLAAVVDPLGRTTGFEVDAAGDLARIVQPDGSDLRFEYDGGHRMTAKIQPDGSRFTYEYDPDYGTLARAIAPTGEMRQYFPAINQGQVLDPAAWTEANPFLTSAPNMGQVIDGNGHARYDWMDQNGDRMAREDALGVVTTYETNDLGMTVLVERPDGAREEIQYDFNGHRTRETLQPPGTTRRWEYSAVNYQLTATEDELGHRTTFEYDDRLNLTKKRTR